MNIHCGSGPPFPSLRSQQFVRSFPHGHDYRHKLSARLTMVRAFLALGLLYVVTSSFTLAKRIRDRQEEAAIASRVDQARLDKLLAEQDLLRFENQGL